ncbi:MAG TPA: NmrA family NAD(P)-binding protein, partial [Polyangiaceae bacterium]
FQGDALDAASVAKALEGADEGAYFLVPPDPKSTGFVARGKKLADGYAAGLAKANVKHAVFLSSVGAQVPSGTGPIVTARYAEEALGKTKTPFTFLRAAYFMENVLNYAHPIKADGVLPVFGGGESYPFPMVATRDIGRVAAESLLAPVAQSRVIELSGPEEYSLEQAAAEASKIVGKPVKATPLPIDALAPALVQLGFSEDVANLYREMTEAFGSGKVGFEGTPIRGKVTLAEVLRAGLS